ncbi:MAG: nucleotide sugar dehydrogenase [Gammaproteobacteria bacterium]
MTTVAVIGLGYVGLPLAVQFGKVFDTIGFDLSAEKIASFQRREDPTGEVSREQFEAATRLQVTGDAKRIGEADFLVVAVPTPVGEAHQPDFSPLISASTTCGRNMKRGATVIYESTVYPGATEEVCIPVLERESGMTWKRDFHVGYSPERINPGDREHTLTSIVKVVSGDDADTLGSVARLYEAVVTAGVHRASSIKVAEAAKVIENTQRDLNIALINELAILFNRLGIDTEDVLLAAGTKWNFLPFRPGLVGGHCIGVDPYYLLEPLQQAGVELPLLEAAMARVSGRPAEVARRALELNCAGIILAHNHPSGVAEPSAADRMLTDALRSALRPLDIPVLDHLIVAGNRCFSFAEAGLL